MTIQHRTYKLVVQGRTLEHLGVQMYKQRDAAIAELVANAWDAGATTISITLPDPATYSPTESTIAIGDNGCGMDPDAVGDEYLVVGRNRRADSPTGGGGRAPMGRKGIGKLAAFGLARSMELTTTAGGAATTFSIDAQRLKTQPGTVADVPIEAEIVPVPEADSGTRIVLKGLKHSTPLEAERLRAALGRRFSRTIRGSMTITVNGVAVVEPEIPLSSRTPAEGATEETLADGSVIRFAYGFSDKPIPSPELRGWVIYVRGKTAQNPPWYFGVEGTASGQHATRYLTGFIEADYLDEGTDDDDLISTDRQEIDWLAAPAQSLRTWGEELTRRLMREWASRRGDQFHDWLLERPDFQQRIQRLDRPSLQQATRLVKSLGSSGGDHDALVDLADSLVRAFEYRQFHDVIAQVEEVEDDPEQLQLLLARLRDWKVLESRAILEIVKGRLGIIEKFHGMIANDAPETAPRVGADNLHDLLAQYPWLINPEWQVLAEEKTLSKQLRDWGTEEISADDRSRYDFLGLVDERRLVIIEIKRASHIGTLDDIQRLERYQDRLSTGSTREIRMVFIGSGRLSFPSLSEWEDRSDLDLLTWGDLHDRAFSFYRHYRDVLESDVGGPDFARKEEEVARTRQVLEGAAYRDPAARALGLGPQDSASSEGDATR